MRVLRSANPGRPYPMGKCIVDRDDDNKMQQKGQAIETIIEERGGDEKADAHFLRQVPVDEEGYDEERKKNEREKIHGFVKLIKRLNTTSELMLTEFLSQLDLSSC